MPPENLSIHGVILRFSGQHKAWVGANFLLMIVHFPLELIALSYLSGKIFTLMTDMKTNYTRVVKMTIGFFLIYFLIELFVMIRDVYDSYIVPHLEREIRNHVINKIMDKNEVQFDHLEMGEMVVRFLKTPAYSLYSYVVLTKFIIPFVASLVFIGVYIVWLDARVGALYFLLFSVYSAIMIYFCLKMVEATKKRMLCEMEMFNKIEDTLSNMQTIYTCDTVGQEKENMDKEQMAYIGIHQEEMHFNTQIKMVLASFCLFSIVLLFLLSIYLFRKRQIRQETLVSLTTLFLFMCRFLGYTSRKIVEGMVSVGSFVDSNEFIGALCRDTLRDGTEEDFIGRGEISFEGVSFRYNKGSPFIFKDFSMVVPPGTRLALVGDSGSGKTTFLRLVLGFYTLEKGVVRVDGVDVAKSRRRYLRNRIAYINQSTKLFDRTILENILYGTKGRTERDVEVFVRENGLGDIFNKTGGFHARAGKGGEKLSGGMRQVVLLMRCVFQDCPIVILDECTSNIGAKHRRSAMVIIRKLCQARTVVCVSHDTDIIRLFDKKLVFENNKQPRLV